ncbi:MAG: glycosyltransferase [Planctomycetota bacterium]
MNQKLKVVFNATSLRPGGGLTVLLGVLQGLKHQQDLDLEAIVICGAQASADAVKAQGVASEVILKCKDQGMWRRQWFVTMSLGSLVNQLDADLFFSVNQFVRNVACPQVVYHLNLLRFLPIDRSRGLVHGIAEWLRNRSAKQAIQKADANVFESNYLLQCATEAYGVPHGPAEVIYIGLPDELIDQLAEDTPSDVCSSTLMAITNHNEHKDNPTLIRVLRALVEKHPEVDWRMKIAGSIFPEKWQPFKELASELGVASRIDWLGFVSQEELTDHLKDSLCLVSTSRIESFCMVALESMARGCPAVVANASSMPESVGDAAVLVSPGDHNEFAEAIATFYAEPTVRADFVEFGFERIETFRWERCGREFAELLRRLKK